jgi:glutamine amidotransferase
VSTAPAPGRGPRIAVIDYHAGNITSLLKGLTAVGAAPFVTRDPVDLYESCTGIVIPGVGNFAATAAIDPDLRTALQGRAGMHVPILGICLGMQFLYFGSEEATDLGGLELLPGRCSLLRGEVKVPHVGWNTVARCGRSELLDGIGDGAYFYFTHSYAAPIANATVGTTSHGSEFAAIVDDGRHVFGVQFHPEKSGEDGMRILRNFVALC